MHYNNYVTVQMIKHNRRVPGTINSTPINKIKYPNPHNENQVRHAQLPTFNNNVHLEQTNKHNKLNSWKGQNLSQTLRQTESGLMELNLKQKGISDLQVDIDESIRFNQVAYLNLSNNAIIDFPPTIFNKLSSLASLHLSNNKLQKISFPYFKENRLKIMDISFNNLKSLNLEHVDSLIKLDCNNNQISFLTLPPMIQLLSCSNNKLSNIYFMEHCYLLQEVHIANNVLYDLKFNFKPYIKFKDENQKNNPKDYEKLHTFNASNNKIQYIEGMQHISHVKILRLDNNQLSFTRHTLNQMFVLKDLEELAFENNPIHSSGYSQSQIIHHILSHLPNLLTLNGQDLSEYEDQYSDKCCSTQRKSQFSGINEEPYQLFMDSHRKPTERQKQTAYKEWNFTLGDCQNEGKEQQKIHQLSEIQVINTCDLAEPFLIGERQQRPQPLRKTDLDETYHLGLIHKKDKEMKIKVLKSTAPMVPHHHVYYQEFLNALLPMSYVPVSTLLSGADYTGGRRLQNDDDQYILIDKMFSNRGGVSYAKKISKWNILQNGKQIFSRHPSEPSLSSIGFLLNHITEEQFRQLTKFNRLIRKNQKDIIGMQPNAFTYFHVLVRHSPQSTDDFYQSLYLIQTFQL